MKEERLKMLSAMPVFGGLAPATLELVVSLARPVTMAAGDHFFREGDETQLMYVLESGEVDIYKTWEGHNKLLRRMGTGDCFGEMALVDLFPRSASAIAVVQSEALEIDTTIFQQIFQQDLEQYTLLQMNMGREISRRLRRVDELLFRAFMGAELPEASIDNLS